MQKSLIYLGLLLICLSGRPGFTDEIVTGQETSTNQMPAMSEFTRSGGTSIGTGAGCTSGEYCTAGKHGPGGTYSTTFDLEDAMTIDQINRGFDLDYGMDVDSHQSNTTVPTCSGNTMAAFDCKDIFRLTVSLFDENAALQHKFEHEVELDFSGLQTYSYSQTISENSYTGLTGEFEMFGIDAGFQGGYYGPQFSNPALTATYDLVTLIETEILDVLQQTDILTDSSVQTVEIDTTPPPPDPEMEEMEAQVEQEMAPPSTETMGGGTTGPPPPPEAAEFQTPPQEQQEQQEVQTEVEQEIEAEVATEPEPEPEPESEPEVEPDTEAAPDPESSSPSEEAQPEPEPESEAEPESDSPKVLVKKSVKEKIAKRIMKRMGDKGRYDASNQLKTLVVMQVLGNGKSFFKATTKLEDTAGFFSTAKIPDAVIDGNNFAQYILFGGSNAKHDAMVNSQYR
jgi:hypothetical protein